MTRALLAAAPEAGYGRSRLRLDATTEPEEHAKAG